MRKKKGSTLITVVAIFAVIFTVGTSVLALTASSYKSRIIESRRVENLYSAESGLDIAYSITGKVVEQAIKKGNNDVNSLLTAGSVDQNTMNTTFQNSFRQVIMDSDNGLANCITNKKLLTDATSNPKQTSDISNQTSATFTVDLAGNVPTNPSYYSLNITSSYEVNSSTGTEHRQIQSNYKITVPTYSGAYGKQSKKVSINVTPIMKYMLAADGDLTINGVQTFKLSAVNDKATPIFIKGNEVDNSIANKYEGGISIRNTTSVEFIGNVVTSKTLKFLSSNDNVYIHGGNLYANNIYSARDGSGSTSEHILKIGDTYDASNPDNSDNNYAVLDNDLTINDSYSNIQINGGLYAVSDISLGDSGLPSSKSQKERSSSSIIINSTDDTSKLSVGHEAYIMGTAYINTSTPYQTGESVAIKGNYNAYTTILDKETAKYFYSYYEPLQLLDKDNITVVDKSAHFYNYATNESYKANIKVTNNISLPDNTSSIGAYISNGQVRPSYWQSLDSQDPRDPSLDSFFSKVSDRQREYANNVYEMGESLDSKGTIYSGGTVKKTVATEVKLDANNDNNDGISSHMEIDPSKDIIIINTDNSKYPDQVPNDIYIKGNGSTIPTHQGDIVISGNDLKGIIVTAGNVYIDGSVNFKGTIISKKDINISGRGKNGGDTVNLTYDANYLQTLIAKNKSLFDSVFVTSNSATSQTVTVSDINTASLVQNAIDPKQYISKGVWKINQ